MTDLRMFDPSKVRGIIEGLEAQVAELRERIDALHGRHDLITIPELNRQRERAEKAERDNAIARERLVCEQADRVALRDTRAALAAEVTRHEFSNTKWFRERKEMVDAFAAMTKVKEELSAYNESLISQLAKLTAPVSDEEEREALVVIERDCYPSNVGSDLFKAVNLIALLLVQRTAKLRAFDVREVEYLDTTHRLEEKIYEMLTAILSPSSPDLGHEDNVKEKI